MIALLKQSTKDKVSFLQIIGDLWKIKGAL